MKILETCVKYKIKPWRGRRMKKIISLVCRNSNGPRDIQTDIYPRKLRIIWSSFGLGGFEWIFSDKLVFSDHLNTKSSKCRVWWEGGWKCQLWWPYLRVYMTLSFKAKPPSLTKVRKMGKLIFKKILVDLFRWRLISKNHVHFPWKSLEKRKTWQNLYATTHMGKAGFQASQIRV